MPRDIPVGNGNLLICFDKNYFIRDIYYPHVGQENHVGGAFCRFGVWVNGEFSWIGGDQWDRDIRYLPDTLATEVSLHNKELELLLVCRDAVDFHENVYLREVSIENLSPKARDIRLFFGQDLNISGNDIGDTAVFDPVSGGVVHYKGARYFLANGCTPTRESLYQFAVGQKGYGGKEGTFKDAEDGVLSGNSIAQGSVDSVISLDLKLEGTGRASVYYWLAAGKDWDEVVRINSLVKYKEPKNLIKRSIDYWELWLRKETPPLHLLPVDVADLYRRSLLVLISQTDWQGGIVAANDSDSVRFNRDTYSYVWPREGALAAHALDQAGYPLATQQFYRFISDIIRKEGYLLHKYNPDGTLASSWHPWWENGETHLPIQEDETALVIWALWHHFVKYRDIEFIKPLYRPLVKAAADFLCQYRDEETGLPGFSYDLWEERRGIHSFTVGAVFGGLTAASLFCTVFGETEKADYYKKCAASIRDAVSIHLWNEQLNRFGRMLHRDKNGKLQMDSSADSSMWGLFAFGLYSATDPKIVSTMEHLREKLWVKTDIGGMARYENDYYFRISETVTGNPWFLCTLWLADYLTERSEDETDLNNAIDLLRWSVRHSLPSLVLAEQVNPFNGEPISVFPLTWSHATFVSSTHRILRRFAKIKRSAESEAAAPEWGVKEDWLEQLYGSACEAIRGICKIE
jgi:glucoamylase